MKKLIKKLINYSGYEIKKNSSREERDLYVKLFGSDSVSKRRFYNISVGAYKGFGGGINHPYWTNIDVDKNWKNDKHFPNGTLFNTKTDISHDLLSMTPVPVETSTAELVHSRFTVDRLTDKAAKYFFKEVFRILKPGGIFRIISTNLDLDYRAYVNKDKDYFFWLNKDWSLEQMFLFHLVTQLSTYYPDKNKNSLSDEELKKLFCKLSYEDALDYCVSKCSLDVHKKNRYDHFNWWNQKKYEKMLKLTGFKSIYLSAPGQSASPVLRNNYYFDNEHNKVMMYMEARKV